MAATLVYQQAAGLDMEGCGMNIKELWAKAAETTEDDSWDAQVAFMQRFAELVAAHEREECAKLCESFDELHPEAAFHRCSAVIRARSKA